VKIRRFACRENVKTFK